MVLSFGVLKNSGRNMTAVKLVRVFVSIVISDRCDQRIKVCLKEIPFVHAVR